MFKKRKQERERQHQAELRKAAFPKMSDGQKRIIRELEQVWGSSLIRHGVIEEDKTVFVTASAQQWIARATFLGDSGAMHWVQTHRFRIHPDGRAFRFNRGEWIPTTIKGVWTAPHR
jgi:hypothetical protein